MKQIWCFLFIICFMMGCTGYAQPILSDVALTENGTSAWQIRFRSSEGGQLAIQIRDQLDQTNQMTLDLGAVPVEAGEAEITWDGVLADGTRLAAGQYYMVLRVRNFWGEESDPAVLPLSIREGAGTEVLDLSQLAGAEEVLSWDEMQDLADDEGAEAARMEAPADWETEGTDPGTAGLESAGSGDPDAEWRDDHGNTQ